MAQQNIIHEITRLAAPVIRSAGLALWGVECIPSGRTLVRIYVDTPDGAFAGGTDADVSARGEDGRGPSIDQCAHVSRHVGLALEAEELIPRAYVLEVSSPGLERPFFALAQLAPYVGSDVELKLAHAPPELPDRKRLRGRLLAVGEHACILLAYDAPEAPRLSIPWDTVRQARLAPELPFSNPEKPGKKHSARRAEATSK